MKNFFTILILLLSGMLYGQPFEAASTLLQTNLDNFDAGIPVDFDEDGDMDILFNGDSLNLFINDGNLNFSSFLSIFPGSASDILMIEDINGDDAKDILLQTGWFLNEGNNQFGEFQEVCFTCGIVLRYGDVDLDGDIDYLSQFDGEIKLYVNAGDATFVEEFVEDALFGNFVYFFANMDNEGDLEIVRASLGFPDGMIRVNTRVSDSPPTYESYFQTIPNLKINPLRVADLDNDGDDDFVYGGSSDLHWIRNDGGSLTQIQIGSLDSDAVMAHDFDGDGDNDLVYMRDIFQAKRVQYLENLGNGDFASSVTLTDLPDFTFNTFPGPYIRDRWLQAADFDGDGVDDLMVYSEADDEFVWLRKRDLPVANFSADIINGCAPMTVNYTDASTANVTSWNWSFEGGTPSTSTDQNPTVVYDAAGTYQVELEVTNDEGMNTLTRTEYIEVADVPTGDFMVVSNEEGMVAFMANVDNADDYFWDYGDELGNGAGTGPTHFFPFSGTYTVTLEATNDCGTAVFQQEVTVNVSIPYTALKVTMDRGDLMFGTAFLNASGIMGSGAMDSDGDGIFRATAFIPHGDTMFYRFTGLGPITQEDFTLLEDCAIENNNGDLRRFFIAGTDPNETIVELSLCFNSCEACPAPPTAGFTFETTELTATYTDNSAGATGWLWDFGDGETSTEQNPVYTYASSDTYDVCLIASNDIGADTICDMVTVLNTATVDLATALGIQVYPNPTKDVLYMNFANLPTSLSWSLYDLTGKILMTDDGRKITTTAFSLDMSLLNAGMYYLKIVDEDGAFASRKIIKQ